MGRGVNVAGGRETSERDREGRDLRPRLVVAYAAETIMTVLFLAAGAVENNGLARVVN